MIRFLIDWSELGAMLIPLPFMFNKKPKPAWFKPVRIYVCVAILLNLGIMLIWKYKKVWGAEPGDFLWSNLYLYNFHSIVRMLLFSWFFVLLNQRFLHRIKIILPFLFLVIISINYIFYENFFDPQMFSNRMLALEAGILLFYCLQYYIYLTLEEKTSGITKQRGFWIVTGLFIYIGACFFIFLAYSYLTAENLNFAVDLWDVHNIAYVIFGICIAISFRKNV